MGWKKKPDMHTKTRNRPLDLGSAGTIIGFLSATKVLNNSMLSTNSAETGNLFVAHRSV